MRVRIFLLALGLVSASITASTATAGNLTGLGLELLIPGARAAVHALARPGEVLPGSRAGRSRTSAPAGSSTVRPSSAATKPFAVRGAKDGNSLSIPNGASATTPAMCATLLHPDLRFFVRNKGFLLGVLRVDVLVDTPLGVVTLPVGVVPAGRRGRRRCRCRSS